MSQHTVVDLIRWMEDGMTDDSGLMVGTSPLPLSRWVVPGMIDVDGPDLVWDSTVERPFRVSGESSKAMLDRFVRLVDEPGKKVRAFAERWGVLTAKAASGREPLADWQAFAGDARAVLRIAAQLHRNETPPDDAWDLRTVRVRPRGPAAVEVVGVEESFVGRPREALAFVLGGWLRDADVRPDVSWSDGAPKFELRPGGLRGAIALRLAYTVTAGQGLGVCSNCGKPYTPDRRPAPGRRSYCAECRASGAPRRDANREYRRRVKSEGGK